MKFTFDIGTKLIVTLKETMYFWPWRETREVQLLSLETVQTLIDCPNGLEMAKVKLSGLLAAKTLIGEYVGDRNRDGKLHIIKLRPFCPGLMNPESDYFIIYPDDIQSINEYQLVTNE